MRVALITGATGQDGSYLTEYLIEKGYRVFCGIRRLPQSAQTLDKSSWVTSILTSGKVEFVHLDVRDELDIRNAIRKSWPDEIYNLAGQVYVPTSWDTPAETFDVNTGGLARILRVVEDTKKDTKVYQASSSEMFGNVDGGLCSDNTPMNPTSPYGVSKYAAHKLAGIYRDRGLFVVSGILFNHESPRRGHEMVTRKIVRTMAGWSAGSKDNLALGNLEARRDWGYAKEYVTAMYTMLQYDEPQDYVVGTGVTASVADFIELTRQELAIPRDLLKKYLTFDERFIRTQEIHSMCADTQKMRHTFGWRAEVGLNDLVRIMVQAELEKLERKEVTQ